MTQLFERKQATRDIAEEFFKTIGVKAAEGEELQLLVLIGTAAGRLASLVGQELTIRHIASTLGMAISSTKDDEGNYEDEKIDERTKIALDVFHRSIEYGKVTE